MMGTNDLDRIHPIYRASVDFCKLADIPFHFKVDSGNYETGIVFNDLGYSRRVKDREDWNEIKSYSNNPQLLCPDILDYQNKIIVEFEEETGNRKTGAYLAKKGHGHEGDYDTKRDTRRNEYYTNAGYRVLRIWESHYKHSTVWKLKLFEFLINCTKEAPKVEI